MLSISPVIDDKKFIGSDKGLVVPLRRTTAATFALRIGNLDHSDPPAPYSAGGVPRTQVFNANVVRITATPKMPKITVQCDLAGFDAAKTKILWRLETLYVVGRYKKISGGSSPHYRSRILTVGDIWTGQASSASFSLFDDDPSVEYDNASDRVAGGHGILTIAAKPDGCDSWLQDYVHVRITGSNPTEAIVRKHVHDALSGRDGNIEYMADAVFAWENSMRQFEPGIQTHATYKNVRFDWPPDPANFPSVAFDFGIGLGQYTHPGKETTGICWDWRDNLDAGMNELLDDLRATFSRKQTFLDWAKNAWSMYNTGHAGASPYAARLARSADGRKINVGLPPNNFDPVRQTAHVPGRPVAPSPRPWPVQEVGASYTISRYEKLLAQSIVDTVSSKISDVEVLAWLWPKIETEIINHGGYDHTAGFPGLDQLDVAEHLAVLDRSARQRTTDAAFSVLWLRLESSKKTKKRSKKPTARFSAAAYPGGISDEFRSLIPLVRSHVDGGIGGWSKVRLRMFALFGAEADPAAAVRRINAYYSRLEPAEFPPETSETKGRDTPVHPVLKSKLERTADLLQSRGLSSALNFGDIGGFNIRNNANNPKELSNHSFGWAVDLDPQLNPNVKRTNLPLSVIKGLTGLDLYGPASESLRTARPFDVCLSDAIDFSHASRTLVEAFRDETKLKSISIAAIKRSTGQTLELSQIDRVFAAAPSGQAAVRRSLTAAGLSSTDAASISRWIVAASQLFPQAKSIKEPSVTGNSATVARFGFCNLAPELIAALVASDGGGLNWLGAARTTKDFMHFDLRPQDQPPLFSRKTEPSRRRTGGAHSAP